LSGFAYKREEENRKKSEKAFSNLVLAQWWHTHCVVSIRSNFFPDEVGRRITSQGGKIMARGFLLWLLGVPFGLIVLLWLFGFLS
jgi:hypothetical protein